MSNQFYLKNLILFSILLSGGLQAQNLSFIPEPDSISNTSPYAGGLLKEIYKYSVPIKKTEKKARFSNQRNDLGRISEMPGSYYLIRSYQKDFQIISCANCEWQTLSKEALKKAADSNAVIAGLNELLKQEDSLSDKEINQWLISKLFDIHSKMLFRLKDSLAEIFMNKDMKQKAGPEQKQRLQHQEIITYIPSDPDDPTIGYDSITILPIDNIMLKERCKKLPVYALEITEQGIRLAGLSCGYGWYRTEDLGFLNEQEIGILKFLFYESFKKNVMLKSKR